MSIPHAFSGVPVDLQPEESISKARSNALIKNDAFEAIRMVIPKDHEVCRNHQVDGPITVYCLQGRISLTSDDQTRAMQAGQWLFLPGQVSHTIVGLEDSLILLTVIFREER